MGNYVRRAIEYRGAMIVVSGGMYVPAMVRPSGPVSRGPPVGTGGWRRRVSVITLWRIGRVRRVWMSEMEGIWENSSRMRFWYLGDWARWEKIHVKVMATVSLWNVSDGVHQDDLGDQV